MYLQYSRFVSGHVSSEFNSRRREENDWDKRFTRIAINIKTGETATISFSTALLLLG